MNSRARSCWPSTDRRSMGESRKTQRDGTLGWEGLAQAERDMEGVGSRQARPSRRTNGPEGHRDEQESAPTDPHADQPQGPGTRAGTRRASLIRKPKLSQHNARAPTKRPRCAYTHTHHQQQPDQSERSRCRVTLQPPPSEDTHYPFRNSRTAQSRQLT